MPPTAWRLTNLLDLFAALGAPGVAARDLLDAVDSDTDKTRNLWLICAVTVAGLNALLSQHRHGTRSASARSLRTAEAITYSN